MVSAMGDDSCRGSGFRGLVLGLSSFGFRV